QELVRADRSRVVTEVGDLGEVVPVIVLGRDLRSEDVVIELLQGGSYQRHKLVRTGHAARPEPPVEWNPDIQLFRRNPGGHEPFYGAIDRPDDAAKVVKGGVMPGVRVPGAGHVIG